MIIAVIIEMVLVCCKGCARKVPTNYVLLFLFTSCQALILSYASSYSSGLQVLGAAATTLGVTSTLTAYAFFTKRDFTNYEARLCVLSFGVVTLSLTLIFVTYDSWWHPVISFLTIMVYGLFIIHDTQLIAGGGKHKLGLDEYIVAALIIYIDIICMFTELLKLCGSRSS